MPQQVVSSRVRVRSFVSGPHRYKFILNVDSSWSCPLGHSLGHRLLHFFSHSLANPNIYQEIKKDTVRPTFFLSSAQSDLIKIIQLEQFTFSCEMVSCIFLWFSWPTYSTRSCSLSVLFYTKTSKPPSLIESRCSSDRPIWKLLVHLSANWSPQPWFPVLSSTYDLSLPSPIVTTLLYLTKILIPT